MPIKNNAVIFRNDLQHLFDSLSDQRFIYVFAPVGYGKTVSVRQWLGKSTRLWAVATLDEYDNNSARFCERFCAALQACQPKNTELAKIVSHFAFASAPGEFTAKAIDILSDQEHCTLIIDDLHSVTNQQTLCLMLFFLSKLPETFQVVLISRHDLPPGFSDLWVNGNPTKVTSEHFLFSSVEVMSLYKKRGSSLTKEQAEEIQRFTGGWAIGVGALLLSGGDPSGKNLDFLEQFIRQNVWERWDPETREFILRTAAARELNPSLCAYLTGVSDSKKLLGELMRGGAFIFQSSDGIYHYHHLFQDFLKQMMKEHGDSYISSLLEKEGEWHLLQKDFYNAAECFIRAGNHDGIARCFDLLEFADRNEFIIEKMLPIIKDSAILEAAEKYPFLNYLMSWAAFAEGRADDMALFMDHYYTRYPEIAERDPAHAHNILFLHLFDFRVPLRDIIHEAASLPVKLNINGSAGSLTLNMPAVHRCMRDFSEFSVDNTEEYVSLIGGMIGWLLGEEANLLVDSLTAGLLYEQGHLEKAHVHALAANTKIKEHFAPESKFCAMSILVNILDAMGETIEAEHIIRSIYSMIERDSAYYLNYNFRALTARRKISNGDNEAASEWISVYGTTPYSNVTLHGIYATFTSCRAYIAVSDYDSAIILLTKALKLATAYNRPLDIIETKILLSIAYWNKKFGFQEEAMKHFRDAVSLACNFAYTQIFVNDKAALSEVAQHFLSNTVGRDGEDTAYVGFVQMLNLLIFEPKNSMPINGQHKISSNYTKKQRIVIKLLREGKSYKEITEIMGIKLPTLRSHIALIYRKLNVVSETDAILKIKSSGILEETMSTEEDGVTPPSSE